MIIFHKLGYKQGVHKILQSLEQYHCSKSILHNLPYLRHDYQYHCPIKLRKDDSNNGHIVELTFFSEYQ